MPYLSPTRKQSNSRLNLSFRLYSRALCGHSSSSADTSLQARFAADAAGPSQVAAKLQKIKNNQREERARRLTEVSGCTIKAFTTRGLSINIRVRSSDSVVVAQEAARAISFRADHALNAWVSLMSFDEEPMKLSRACQHERRMFRSNKERNKICGRTQKTARADETSRGLWNPKWTCPCHSKRWSQCDSRQLKG